VTIAGEIRWNYSMLHPDTMKTTVPGGSISISRDTIAGGERVLGFVYNGPLPSSSPLATIDMLVLLGLGDTTSLRWGGASVSSSNPGFSATIAGRQGSFTTLGICRIGGDRYVRLNGGFGVNKIAPNPARSEMAIEFETVERGITTLRLVDYLGREARRPVDQELPAGAHSVVVEVGDLPSGVYFYELRSATQTARGKVVVTE
jgi:hypothetical protein